MVKSNKELNDYVNIRETGKERKRDFASRHREKCYNEPKDEMC